MLISFYMTLLAAVSSLGQLTESSYFSPIILEANSGQQCTKFTTGSSVTSILKITLPYTAFRFVFAYEINDTSVVTFGINNELITRVKIRPGDYFSRITARFDIISNSSSSISLIATVTLSQLNATDNGIIFSPYFNQRITEAKSSSLSVSPCPKFSNERDGVEVKCTGADPCVYGSSALLTCTNDEVTPKRSFSTRCGECAEFEDTSNCSQGGCDAACYVPIIVVFLWILGIIAVGWLYYKYYKDFPSWAQNIFIALLLVFLFPFGLSFLLWWMFCSKSSSKDNPESPPHKVEPLMEEKIVPTQAAVYV